MHPIDPSEITPEHVYLNRRRFMVGIGALTASAFALGTTLSGCRQPATGSPTDPASTPGANLTPSLAPQAQADTDELGNPLTEYEAITGYTNFYEFSIIKEDVARHTQNFRTSPWQVQVGGLVDRPTTFTLEELLALEQEERIYRMRCVEGWSMVIPWIGFPLARILERVQPTAEAKYVRLETLYAPEQMPGQSSRSFNWPYVEGLRLDEAMHDLTILATGLYGKPLTKQNGAPIRLVVPWKYGFKSIKSVVKIDCVAEMPISLWMASSPSEYGFYANVNPNVDHPRWSQATERRIGEIGRRPTLMFNGYEEEVAALYEGMDLTEYY